MLKANRSVWFERVFTLYNRNLIKRRFHSFNVKDLDSFKNRNINLPTIIFANHSSWWDGLIIFQLVKETDLKFFVMMEQKQLVNLQLFRKLGAFSVVREDPRSALKSINYSVQILKENANRVLLIFPQGEITPKEKRPIVFFNGISKITEKVGECNVFSMAIQYEFLDEYKPEIFLTVSKMNNFEKLNTKEKTRNFEDKLTEQLENLKKLVINKEFTQFKNIV